MSFYKTLCCIANKYSKLSLSRILNNAFLYRSLSSFLKFRKITFRNLQMNSIDIQDPMLLMLNVTERVDYITAKKLFPELMSACRLFQTSSYMTSSPNKQGISTPLNKQDENLPSSWQKGISFAVPLIPRASISPPSYDKGEAKLYTAETLLSFLDAVLLFDYTELEMSEVIDMLKKHDKKTEKLRREVEVKNQFSSNLVKLHKQCKENPESLHNIDTQKFDDGLMVEDFQELCSKNKLLLCAECKVFRNCWLGRDYVNLQSVPAVCSSSLPMEEYFISIQTAERNELNITDEQEKMKPLVFLFECYESPELTTLLVNIRPFEKDNFNPMLGMFLKEYLPKLIGQLTYGWDFDPTDN